MSLSLTQRRLVRLVALCLGLLIAAACHSARNADNRRTGESMEQSASQPATKAGERPAGQPAQIDATALKKADLTPADRAAWRATLNWPSDCEEEYEATAGNDQAALRFFELAPSQYLVEVRCAFGAYQRDFQYMFYDESQAPPASRLLTFKNYTPAGDSFESLEPEETTKLSGESSFNPDTRELMILRVFRGPGDCGAWARYGFEQGRPQLLEFRAKTACDGKAAGDPQNWRKVNLTTVN